MRAKTLLMTPFMSTDINGQRCFHHDHADTLNHGACPVRIFDDPFDGLTRLAEVGLLAGQPVQTRTAVSGDRGERLARLMADGGRQLA